MGFRTWQLPKSRDETVNDVTEVDDDDTPSPLSGMLQAAECLHILRPVVHRILHQQFLVSTDNHIFSFLSQ